MSPAVHVNGSEAVRSTRLEDVKALQFSIIDELCAIRRPDLARAAGRFTPHVGFVPDLDPVIKQRSCPGLERNVVDVEGRGLRTAIRIVASWVDCQAPAASPESLLIRR